MFEYDFLNFIYVGDDCREIKELLEKITEVVNDLKRISKTKEMIFIKILTACPEYCENKWYPTQHMIQVGISNKKVSPAVDLDKSTMIMILNYSGPKLSPAKEPYE